eukprot:762469-Hanusia_phi.AAC.2
METITSNPLDPLPAGARATSACPTSWGTGEVYPLGRVTPVAFRLPTDTTMMLGLDPKPRPMIVMKAPSTGMCLGTTSYTSILLPNWPDSPLLEIVLPAH